MSNLFQRFLTWFSSDRGKACLLQAFPLISGSGVAKGKSSVKTKEQEVLSASAVSVSLVARSPFSTFSSFHILVFLLLLMDLQKPFFLFLTSLPRLNSRWALSFQTTACMLRQFPVFLLWSEPASIFCTRCVWI